MKTTKSASIPVLSAEQLAVLLANVDADTLKSARALAKASKPVVTRTAEGLKFRIEKGVAIVEIPLLKAPTFSSKLRTGEKKKGFKFLGTSAGWVGTGTKHGDKEVEISISFGTRATQDEFLKAGGKIEPKAEQDGNE